MTVRTTDWLRAAPLLRVTRGRDARTQQVVVKATCCVRGALHASLDSRHAPGDVPSPAARAFRFPLSRLFTMKTKIPPGTPTVPLMVAAVRLGVQYHTARSLVLNGTLTGDRTPGGWIVTEASITQYETQRTAAKEKTP